ncbi:pathway-specific regulatory protein [Penicillium verhagenii]|nr:pathway-specific regulatory protein [Penicillium verhagenii]
MSHQLEETLSSQYYGKETRPTEAESKYYRDLLFGLFQAAPLAERSRAQKLLEMSRDNDPAKELRAILNGMLANARLSEMNEQIIGFSFVKIEDHVPRARPRVLDVHYLCNIAPFRVPARPWTSVTDSDDLVSHLVSLYLTWGYPFYAFFCRDTFLRHMRLGHLNSDFCSPFLVNALLANACFYSDYSEAYSLPGDVKRKGAQFLAEAEWHLRSHQFESGSDTRLASLQATLLYSMCGKGHFGYMMLHRAMEMAGSLGIVNNAKILRLEKPRYSEDMITSLKQTAWGLFQVDTSRIVHTNFLRKSHIKSVNVDHIDNDKTREDEQWTPYPIRGELRSSHLSLYFNEACKLSYIARDVSWDMSRTHNNLKFKQEMYDRLRKWEKECPHFFESTSKPAPYIIVLRMRYHTLVINLWLHDLHADTSSVRASENTTDLTSPDSNFDALSTALSSARELATLVQVYSTEYGLIYCHQFALYAINVALFCMLMEKALDILDPDFLNLTRAFSIIACRSHVGRHLFHAFKLSVRSRNQGGQMWSLDDASPAVNELFGLRENCREPDRWDHYAEGLAEVDGEGSFLKDLDMDPVIPGLHDMLKWYERLSVGKEMKWRRNKKPDF